MKKRKNHLIRSLPDGNGGRFWKQLQGTRQELVHISTGNITLWKLDGFRTLKVTQNP